MQIRELTTDPELNAAFALMSQLRDRIGEASFLPEVRRQQVEGYRLYGGFEGDALVCLAGVRRSHTLSRGEHFFVDDLVTSQGERGRGRGREMIAWLAARAREQGVRRIYLDSRSTAKGFYERMGFTFLTSVPCWLDVDTVTIKGGTP